MEEVFVNWLDSGIEATKEIGTLTAMSNLERENHI